MMSASSPSSSPKASTIVLVASLSSSSISQLFFTDHCPPHPQKIRERGKTTKDENDCWAARELPALNSRSSAPSNDVAEYSCCYE